MINELPKDIQEAINSRGNFEIKKICPKGANSYVVLGIDKTLDREVAIKFIYDEAAVITEEPKKLFQINHKNVLEVYDAKIFAEDSLYFVTPVASGGDLDDLINSSPISLKESLMIIHGILDGINQLHSPPEVYVHRDIKPSNIFMKSRTPVLGDFGSIKKINSGSNSVPASQMSLFFKTPESISKQQHYIQSDIYQVGLILYKMLGGSLPYNPQDYMSEKEKLKYTSLSDPFEKSKYEDQIVHKYILNGKIINKKSLPIYIPNNLLRLLSKSTNKDYSKRFNSITDFMHEIIKVHSNIPDWVDYGSYIALNNFNKKDFKIDKVGNYFYIHRKTIGSTKWRKDKDSKTDSMNICIKLLIDKIK